MRRKQEKRLCDLYNDWIREIWYCPAHIMQFHDRTVKVEMCF